jgi:hypothetical protein
LTCLFVLSACAIADIPAPTESPPLTLLPPATTIFAGNCNNTSDLEHWAQSAAFLTQDFVRIMGTAAEQSRGEIYDDVIQMAELRDLMSESQTPDCAVEAQTRLLGVMNAATEAFQSFANGDLDNIADAVVDLNARFAEATALQDELIVRLDNQVEAQPVQGDPIGE